jgi:hypothetical protein
MKEWLKKYWSILAMVVFLLVLPLLINLCYRLESDCSELHAPSAWATFWATYLAAIASFAMVFITWLTLKKNKEQNDAILQQNKDQLNEMKRQWEEQNTPIVSCSLEKSSESLLVELHNTSQVPAHKIRVRIDNNTGNDIYRFDKTCELLEKMTFEIPPFSIKQIPIMLTPYIEGEYEGYLSVELSYCGKQERFDLYLKEINLTTWKYSTKDICSKIEHLDNTVKSKNFMQ